MTRPTPIRHASLDGPKLPGDHLGGDTQLDPVAGALSSLGSHFVVGAQRSHAAETPNPPATKMATDTQVCLVVGVLLNN